MRILRGFTVKESPYMLIIQYFLKLGQSRCKRHVSDSVTRLGDLLDFWATF